MTATTTAPVTSTVDLSDHEVEVTELLRMRRESKAVIDSHKAIVTNCEKRLRDLLGPADEGWIGNKRVVWLSRCTNTGVDRDMLLRIAPAIYERVFKSTPYTKLFPNR